MSSKTERASRAHRQQAEHTGTMPLEDLLKKSDTTDYDESVVKFMPTYPGLSLTSHVVLKNVQV